MELTQTFVTALVAATAAARDAYPDEGARIQRGALLVIDGAVTVRCHENYVASGSQPGVAYRVNGTCQCPDATKGTAPEGRCAHKYAVWLTRKALQLEELPPDWYGPPAAIVRAAYDAPSRWVWTAHGWAKE